MRDTSPTTSTAAPTGGINSGNAIHHLQQRLDVALASRIYPIGRGRLPSRWQRHKLAAGVTLSSLQEDHLA